MEGKCQDLEARLQEKDMQIKEMEQNNANPAAFEKNKN